MIILKLSKYLLSLMLVFIFVSVCQAGLPISYLSELPDVPASGCFVNGQGDRDFKDKITEVSDRLSQEVEERKNMLKEAENLNSKKMQNSRMSQPGDPGVDGAAIKKMTREEKKKMAAKMMEQQFGVTPEELKKLKTTSKEGQQGWGKAFMGQMQADNAMSPEKAVQDQKNAMKTAELAQKMVTLAEKIQAPLNKYERKIKEFEDDPLGKQLMKKIQEEETLLAKMQGNQASCKALNGQKNKIHMAREKYCTTLSPIFLAALNDLRTGIIAALPDAEQMEKTQAQIQNIQSGAVVLPEQFDMAGFGLVQDYIHKLLWAYQYDLTAGPFVPDPCDGALGR
ncbi:MAG: hypothetical protein ABIJ31_05130 [Pseudomonadota bacterium]